MLKPKWNVISCQVGDEWEYKAEHDNGWHGTTVLSRRHRGTGAEEELARVPTQAFLDLCEISYKQSYRDAVVEAVKRA